jgi:hypothetical protein
VSSLGNTTVLIKALGATPVFTAIKVGLSLKHHHTHKKTKKKDQLDQPQKTLITTTSHSPSLRPCFTIQSYSTHTSFDARLPTTTHGFRCIYRQAQSITQPRAWPSVSTPN